MFTIGSFDYTVNFILEPPLNKKIARRFTSTRSKQVVTNPDFLQDTHLVEFRTDARIGSKPVTQLL
jgi:hypothetical protein